ncbi:histidine kinase [Pseudanabaena sp. UWO311]|uniref:ATP-binding protein n=1 Tax=Pseudanabaena sp. UWO311 TaxID=2487337 RepID=UPI0011599B44|nr:ATP-binding protein [Pseudanabaena sp. UWO311]TYQ23221.1 histidine kinase [Pseudanabaena sp. UWO311]
MHFKFSPSILSRLGEELIPNPDQGILELVKNSYDADATICEIELFNTEEIGGSIVISDNGMGMDLETLQSGWLVIGKSEKEGASDRTSLDRLRVGSKGLGRLAALRLGTHVELATRPKSQPNIEYSVSICWNDFDTVDSVEQVTLSPTNKLTDDVHGTTILIKNLKVKIGKREINRLARELLLLADPFDTNISFRPKLLGTGFTDLEKQVNDQFFEDAEFFLKASLDEHGYASAKLIDWKGSTVAIATHSDISKYRQKLETSERSPNENNLSTDLPYQKSVPTNFELWIFQLDPQSFSAKNREDNSIQIRRWLESVGGVHLYHRGLRVAPYGDKGDDWLKINFFRSRNPQSRPSTRTVIGRVVAEDSDSLLLQKTDRLGFLENETFLNLQQFAMNTLEWVADFRLGTVEVKQEEAKRGIKPKIAKAMKRVKEIIEINIPDPVPRKETLLVVENYEKITEKEVEILNEELQLYRSLATAGTTSAIFAHESGREINTLKQQVGILNAKMQRYIESEIYLKYFSGTFSTIQKLAISVQGFAKYPIYLLKKEKRSKGNVEIHQVIKDVISLFDPFLESSNTTIELDRVNTELNLRGSTALVEAILINLITNAINAFNAKNAPIQNRKILIRTELSEKFIWLRVMDNALGIQGLTIDEIWLAGKTTTRSGTGLGLKIAKDSVIDLGGQISVIANGQLGGAEFIVQLPLK